MDKDKKKTLTISSDIKKKIDTSSLSTDGKKYYDIKKKKPYKENKNMKKEDKQERIQFAMIWFCVGMLVTQLLMILTQARWQQYLLLSA